MKMAKTPYFDRAIKYNIEIRWNLRVIVELQRVLYLLVCRKTWKDSAEFRGSRWPKTARDYESGGQKYEEDKEYINNSRKRFLYLSLVSSELG